MYLTNNRLASKSLITDIINHVSMKLAEKHLFSAHWEHEYSLLKSVTQCYSKIRLHNLAKTYTISVQGDNIRQTYSKLILFNHQ